MTAYMIVRRHPYGGYAVVSASTLDSAIPEVEPLYHDRFVLFGRACEAAYNEAIENGDVGYTVHQECYDYIDSVRTRTNRKALV